MTTTNNLPTIEDIRHRLDEPIPSDVVAKRKGGAGFSLSYLEGWYVIDRLNQVFGQGNWQYEIDENGLTWVFCHQLCNDVVS